MSDDPDAVLLPRNTVEAALMVVEHMLDDARATFRGLQRELDYAERLDRKFVEGIHADRVRVMHALESVAAALKAALDG